MALTNSSMPLMPVSRPSAVEETAAAQDEIWDEGKAKGL